ncbi:MAG: hypothetical protein ABR961_04585 [Thermoanaerobaculaceae bacterium]|jgi:hypothetical protein
MRRMIFALVVSLVAGAVFAQESPTYTPGENPFQGEFAFVPGQAIGLHVDIQGVRLDSVTLSALGDVRPGDKVKCEAVVAGSNKTDKKATLTAVLLLENADGKTLEKIALDQFRAKAGKEFQERQKLTIGGDALAGARKVYVFVQVAF